MKRMANMQVRDSVKQHHVVFENDWKLDQGYLLLFTADYCTAFNLDDLSGFAITQFEEVDLDGTEMGGE